ncbi:acyltransferase family protein [uncultured Bifidobacterium sp.]|uniref:acyltransferase family protein n=1 Tax=uncultured Bifidobacterium sp. TaxID=165187 RepID=UPI0025FD2D51|nr:acyltransferase family protein [uncultured Bifidobacterium sp.]
MRDRKMHSSHVSHRRSSGIELLRIIAMYAILSHHFVMHNGFSIEQLPPSFTRYFLIAFMAGWGKVGVVVFFTISVWFLVGKQQSIRSSFYRVWILERELLFYIILLTAFYSIFDREDISAKSILTGFLPILTNKWWYVTAYAIFLVLMPAMQSGLAILNSKQHRNLAVFSFLLVGVVPFIPGGIQTAVYTIFGRDRLVDLPMLYGFPVLLTAFGLFLLFERFDFYSSVINRIAMSSFAVYLITDYSSSRILLWDKMFNLGNLLDLPLFCFSILLILFAIYAVCTVFDFLRQVLFAFTVDRNKGKWFNVLEKKLSDAH